MNCWRAREYSYAIPSPACGPCRVSDHIPILWVRSRAAPRPGQRNPEMKRTYIALMALIVLLAAASGGWQYRRWLTQSLPIGPQAVDVEVMPGESLHHVAQEFADKGILVHA